MRSRAASHLISKLVPSVRRQITYMHKEVVVNQVMFSRITNADDDTKE